MVGNKVDVRFNYTSRDFSLGPYYFTGSDEDHSAQFLSTFYDRKEFWVRLLIDYGLKNENE